MSYFPRPTDRRASLFLDACCDEPRPGGMGRWSSGRNTLERGEGMWGCGSRSAVQCV